MTPSATRSATCGTRGGNVDQPQPTSAGSNVQADWPPASVNLSIEDEPINDEFVSEVDAIFQLGGSYADLGEQLAYVPTQRQYVIGMYAILSVRQAVEQLRQDVLTIPRAPGVASAAMPVAVQARNFHYVAVFREKINAQNDQFKSSHLPRGYSDPDPAAQGSVDAYVRGKLRNSRGKMRDLLTTDFVQLLTNIDMESEVPVPTISALLGLMRSSLTPPLPNSAPATDTTDKGRRELALLKARLAYLRLQTIIYYLRQGGESGRQWKNIDEHLRDLAFKSREYRSAFYQLVTRYDRELFCGEVFSNINRDSIVLPTHEDIEALVASTASVDTEAIGDPGEGV
ncbi:uncharacterized protein PGTG_14147 [Puccinia graminis f. sp. tritici CRL 75-36-700-3]|uniref:Uncharacterized protein n=1 Tax=Puccinia graminis f. sp. tritici (strain CRL 75-36-700-3 / race SCCL) TaxID=418459 RepID=E3KX38_PUCGT|nr:uncharacterized protein PGTG_14147 [Puccinia graminis f. sp. tritici CRL 75-36-700-3]EFP88808.2 hypothetical protein PGTG_14147 [Puccinia graminis f. sp. tritici CRL 75-36-700-3]